VRVVEHPVEHAVDREQDAAVGVRVIGAKPDVLASAWDAPPLPIGTPAMDAAAPPIVVASDVDGVAAEAPYKFNAVAYLSSAVVHASLVLLLALITLGTEVAEPVAMLGVIENEEIVDEEVMIDDVSLDAPLEIASSNPVPTELLEVVDSIDEIDVEPPSLDTSDRSDSPLHVLPSDDDLWSPAPHNVGRGGKDGGQGSKGTKEGTGSGKGTGGDGAPAHAVRKGSFAAWTVPKDPRPLTPYKIIIQVTLPEHIKKYSPDDLNGRVEGTDGYAQRIPQPEAKIPTRQELEEMIDSGNVRLGNGGASGDRMARSGRAGGEERAMLKQLLRQGRLKMTQPAGGEFDFRSGTARISVTVPGAKNRVQDRIEIESKILNERQVLEIEF
jgi:hypothetical protein